MKKSHRVCNRPKTLFEKQNPKNLSEDFALKRSELFNNKILQHQSH